MIVDIIIKARKCIIAFFLITRRVWLESTIEYIKIVQLGVVELFAS